MIDVGLVRAGLRVPDKILRPNVLRQGLTAEDEKTLEGARDFFSTGLPADSVARWVIECIRQDAGIIFTNRELRGAIDQRAEALGAAYDACLASPIFGSGEAG